jgi:hypothetical protein
MRFDFGTDEEKAQQARHKLDGWKQAFRLDKRLLYKLDRPEDETTAAAPAMAEAEEKPAQAAGKSKGKAKSKASKKEAAETASSAAPNGKVSLLVRLYFSSHEKLSEERWVGRIPKEEPFKSASPEIIREGDAAFEESAKHFEDLA